MASTFKFKILTGADPQAQYDAITTKDALTFYLLNTGIGYLGSVKLFDATEDTGISNLVTNMLEAGFVADDTSAASTKAIVDYVADKVSNISAVLTTSFFRKVESHTLTADDLVNDAISLPANAAEGDVGLLFTADTDAEVGNESYYFISLVDYLQNVYTFESTNSIELVTGADNKITANLKVSADEKALQVGENGVYINKATAINDGDGTDEGGDAPSADKLVTEEALVNYIVNSVLPAVNTAIAEALSDVVTAAIDDGTTTTE